MIFIFQSTAPKDKIKEFGSFQWVKQNCWRLALQSILILCVAFMIQVDLLFIWAFLPLISVLTFMLGEAAKIGVVLQTLWYLPIIFWQARNEEI